MATLNTLICETLNTLICEKCNNVCKNYECAMCSSIYYDKDNPEQKCRFCDKYPKTYRKAEYTGLRNHYRYMQHINEKTGSVWVLTPISKSKMPLPGKVRTMKSRRKAQV